MESKFHLSPFCMELRQKEHRAAVAAPKAFAPKLGRIVLAGEALRGAVGVELGHLTSNIEPTLRRDAEGLHQMRVALRRTRAALHLFKPHLDPVIAGRFDTELRQLGQVLGTARDWDVFVLETLPAARRGLSADQFNALQHAGERRRQAATTAVEKALRGCGFIGTSLRLTSWLEGGVAGPCMAGGPQTRGELWPMVPDMLDKAAAQMRKRARHPSRQSAEDRHRLRKSLKRLSYAAELLAEPYGRRLVRTYRTRCAALQRALGVANDAAVARRLAVELVADDPALTAAICALMVRTDKTARKALKGVGRATATLLGTRPFWA